MKASALWHISPSHSEVREFAIHASELDNCLIHAAYSMISTGTERTVALSRVPKSLYDDMGVPYMEGKFSMPIKYGYSLVGKVANENHPWAGQYVHLLHPHQSMMWVSKQALSLIPQQVSPKRAVLASNTETALTAIWDAGVSVGDKVLVCGFGMIGALLAMILRQMPGVELYIAEPKPDRAELGRQLGIEIWNGENAFDVAFHTSGTAGGLQTCIDHIAPTGKVIELSWYGDKHVDIALGGDFHSGRKQIIASQVSNIPADRTYRWSYARRKEVVFKLLENPAFDALITGEISLEEAPELFSKIRSNEDTGLSWCINYE